MIDAKYKLIVITPVYEDIEASSMLFRELKVLFNKEIFLVAVDDGSVKQPLQIESLKNANIEGVILKLKRNVGHQKAIAIGLGYVSDKINAEQVVVVMDSDGEDLPSTIPALLDSLKSSDVDVVVAQRRSRVETVKFKLFYEVYKRVFKLLSGRAIDFGNFMALKKFSVQRLVAMQELSTHIAAAVLASRLRIKSSGIHRGARYAGQSKMNFVGLVLHGFKALMVFADDVLVRVGIACGLITAISLIGVILAITFKLIGFATPGWFSIALGILVLILMQVGAVTLLTLMLLGVVRSGSISSKLDYENFIDHLIEVKCES
jgi:glycosyltransferase involved in cell wall biosynthesis